LTENGAAMLGLVGPLWPESAQTRSIGQTDVDNGQVNKGAGSKRDERSCVGARGLDRVACAVKALRDDVGCPLVAFTREDPHFRLVAIAVSTVPNGASRPNPALTSF
jgi:hypothetical protein